MVRKLFLLLLFIVFTKGFSQYHFNGQLAEKTAGKTIYLSIIEDYRKFDRISMEQVLKKTTTDSLGRFEFKGNNLISDNRIYRIHTDDCQESLSNSNHYFGSCKNTKSILFLADNNDTITFPVSFADEVLCNIISTNPKSSVFLNIDLLKEEMTYDFLDFRSEANSKLNSIKWFSKLQKFGEKLNEPLAELYIFDFLSDKRNHTYGYYRKDITQTTYYTELGERLASQYPDAPFTDLYITEIAIDQQIAAKTAPDLPVWKWLFPVLLLLSLLLNVYLFVRQRSLLKNMKITTRERLTDQEQNIALHILKNKTNKEIASELFISVSTVKTHINNLYKKLGINSREEIKERFQ